jgi:hypothetical protein
MHRPSVDSHPDFITLYRAHWQRVVRWCVRGVRLFGYPLNVYTPRQGGL